MQPKYRLYQRSNRASGTFYAEDSVTRARVTLGTKDRAEAEKLLQAKNESHAQPILSRELAKVYLQAQDPQFGTRTWADVAGLIDAAYEGSTKDRFEKFVRSAPVRALMNRRLAETCSTDFLAVFAHPRAGVSTNVQLRILHNRALDLEWILRPVLSKRAWPKVKYGFRRGITREQHETLLAATPSQEYRLFFELLWETGGSQTDIAMLQAEDIDWPMRSLYYSRQKLQSKGKGNACLVIGPALEAILRQLPTEGPLFPQLSTLGEKQRGSYFWKRRVIAGLPAGLVLHSYRYAWAERAQAAYMPEREAMAQYAIALKKEWGIRNGVTPIRYVHANTRGFDGDFYNLVLDLPQAMVREGVDMHGMAANLLRRMPEAPCPSEEELNTLSPGVLQMMSCVNHQYMTLLAEVQKLLPFVRIYEGELEDRATKQVTQRLFYEEREWRAVAFEEGHNLKFNFSDINYFIVTSEEEAEELAKQLLRGGNESDVVKARAVGRKIRVSASSAIRALNSALCFLLFCFMSLLVLVIPQRPQKTNDLTGSVSARHL